MIMKWDMTSEQTSVHLHRCFSVSLKHTHLRQKESKGEVRYIYIYILYSHKSDNVRLMLAKSYLSEIDAAPLRDHPLIKSRTTIVSLA